MKPPFWITSLGALVALAISAAGFFSESGAQADAQRRTDQSERRVENELDRLRDAQRNNRHEISDNLRREIDLACRCCTKQ